jgi:hypothetical protein
MKDAVITLRVPQATRRRLEALARAEGRSLSQQVERLLDRAMSMPGAPPATRRPARPLAGSLRGGRVPTLRDFRDARAALSRSVDARTRRA